MTLACFAIVARTSIAQTWVRTDEGGEDGWLRSVFDTMAHSPWSERVVVTSR